MAYRCCSSSSTCGPCEGDAGRADADVPDADRRVDAGEKPVAEIAMAKNLGGRVMRDCADESIQILGGAGFMRGGRAERIYREVKVQMIGGGSEEILNELAARQLGLG